MANWDAISKLANLAQLYDVALDSVQTSNDEIMKMLLRQNVDYLEKIIDQNDEIIKLLKDGKYER